MVRILSCFAFSHSLHPKIAYRWLDQYVVAFADRAAQLSFNHDLGQRVLRAIHLPRMAQTVGETVAVPLT